MERSEGVQVRRLREVEVVVNLKLSAKQTVYLSPVEETPEDALADAVEELVRERIEGLSGVTVSEWHCDEAYVEF